MKLLLFLVALSACGDDAPFLLPDAGPGADAGVMPPPDAGPGEVAWGACDPTELPPGYTIPDDLSCARIEVPLDRAAPEAGTVVLRVARHAAEGGAGEMPVFQLAGGPGGSSVAQAGIIPRLMPALRRRFDLVYVDQRGTGASGYLACPGGYPETGPEWEDCGRSLSGVALDHHLTADAADDLDDVRARLGHERIFIRAGSYGTRLALEYARRHGDHVAAMVLDGVDPPDADVLSELIGGFDRGMQLLYDDCAADPRCAALAPDLEADVDALIAGAEESPRTITIDGTPYLEDAELFRNVLQGMVMYAAFRFRMPHAVVDARTGLWARWDAAASELFGLRYEHREGTRVQDSYVAPGLYLAVTCAEALPNAPGLEALRALGAAQKYGDAHLADLAAACAVVDVQPLPAASRAPVHSDVPALLLSGALDIQTIPEWGNRAAATLSRSRHLVLPDATHSVMTTPCGASLIEQFFLGGGDPDTVDPSCIDAIDIPFE